MSEPNTQTDCPKCHGAGAFPTPWVGRHENKVVCDCPAGADNALLHGLWPGALLAGNTHQLGLLLAAGRAAFVDLGMADDVRRLWDAGIWTWVSCEGGIRGYAERYVGLTDAQRARDAKALLPWAAEVTPCGLGGVFVSAAAGRSRVSLTARKGGHACTRPGRA